MYYDGDADLSLITKRKVAVIGYGSQGHAHAQNLKDQGADVVVGLYEGSRSAAVAEDDGFRVWSTADAASWADVVMILIPDQYQGKVYEADIAPGLTKGNALAFGHGFNIHFNQIVPPEDVDVFMIAPKSPGHLLRRLFRQGTGVPGLLAVHQDATNQCKELALSYAKGIGCTRAGVIETSFREETETDLFGEQTVLCGGVTQLIKTGFEVLVDAGYQPEIAYFECLHEMKLIVDLIYEGGFSTMRDSVSETAEYGDLTRGPRVIDEQTRESMEAILSEIQSGTFAREWMAENEYNQPVLSALRERAQEHPIESTGETIRSMIVRPEEG